MIITATYTGTSCEFFKTGTTYELYINSNSMMVYINETGNKKVYRCLTDFLKDWGLIIIKD
jgi:predicted regulator of Ras-like GTPase activity (Roadblock/LC7/MglB family)